MWDAAYLLITLLFFAAMVWYVRGCERLGAGGAERGARDADKVAVRRNGGM